MYLWILKTDKHTIMASAVSTQKSACRTNSQHQFSLSETAAGGGGTPFSLGNLPNAHSRRAPRA
jgi:hypothetical protein